MEQQLKSAIIGYYLSGATIEQIIGLTGLFYLQVARVIEEYRAPSPTPSPKGKGHALNYQ